MPDAGAKTCTPGTAGACLSTEYCKLASCGATSGTCTVRPAPSETESPVCGCDNVTYWNETVAAHDFGANVQAGSGECPRTTATKCNGTNLACDGNRACNFEVGSSTQCNLGINTIGTCWGLPTSCPLANVKFNECGTGKCFGHCDAIKAETPFYFNSSCH